MESSKFLEVEFIEGLAQLMKANPLFAEVNTHVNFRGKERLRVDITAKFQDRPLIIECKNAAPLIESRVDEYIVQLEQYGHYEPQSTLVLAIPNQLQPHYQEMFVHRNITVWDASFLATKFRDQLDVIHGSPLYHILIKASPSNKLPPADLLKQRLKALPKGREHWSEYQKLCVDVWEFLFVPPLSSPLYESSDEAGANRRDIILPNYAEIGFWQFLRDKYRADYIVIDSKNYNKGIQKNQVLQMANYLKPFGSGLFGIICSRLKPKPSAIITQREQWIAYNKLIVFIDDNDLIQMLTLKGNDDKAEAVIKQRIEDFRLGL